MIDPKKQPVRYQLTLSELDTSVTYPEELLQMVEQDRVSFAPWHLLSHEMALGRMRGLRVRYPQKYVPFAYRQDNDDLACLLSAMPGKVVLIHDFASSGWEFRKVYASFADWIHDALELASYFDDD
jgi:hypothetical protein